MPPKTYMGRGIVYAQVDVDPSLVEALFLQMSVALSGQGISQFLKDTMDPFIRARMINRFVNEGDDAVGAWLPLAKSTQGIRARSGFPPAHPINIRTHVMRDWLVNTPGEVRSLGADVVMTHPNVFPSREMMEKVTTAQIGRSDPPTPPRPVLGLAENDNLFLQNELVKHILGV